MSRRTRALAQQLVREGRSYNLARSIVRAIRPPPSPAQQGFPAPGQVVAIGDSDPAYIMGYARVICAVRWLGTPTRPLGCEVDTVAVKGPEVMVGFSSTNPRHEVRLLVDPAGREYERHPMWSGEKATGRK